MKAKIISLFNHKGGVSKTTTTFNLAWKLTQLGKRVLLVDADSQCNLTGMMMGDDFENYYTNESTKLMNLMDGARSAFTGKPMPIEAIDCYQTAQNERLFLIPGHMNISEFEPTLSLALSSNNAISTLQNLPGAFYELIRLCCIKYDIEYVFVDLNPGLSAINQVFFVYCDYFIVPTNPDPFSVMAINTLKNILPRWKKWALSNREYFDEASYPLPLSEMKFIGAIIQRFSLRSGTAAKSFQQRIGEIKMNIDKNLVSELKKFDMVIDSSYLNNNGQTKNYCIAEISEFGALLQSAHDAGVPVFALSDGQIGRSGSVLDQMQKNRERFSDIFEEIANLVIKVCDDQSI
jgi:cellulose biosynthesis protein BcsQ